MEINTWNMEIYDREHLCRDLLDLIAKNLIVKQRIITFLKIEGKRGKIHHSIIQRLFPSVQNKTPWIIKNGDRSIRRRTLPHRADNLHRHHRRHPQHLPLDSWYFRLGCSPNHRHHHQGRYRHQIGHYSPDYDSSHEWTSRIVDIYIIATQSSRESRILFISSGMRVVRIIINSRNQIMNFLLFFAV